MVSYTNPTSSFFELESHAVRNLPHRLFDELEEAMVWTDQVIQEARS